MILELESVLNNENGSYPFDYSFDLEGGELLTHSFDPVTVKVSGAVTNNAGRISLNASVTYSYEAQCDLCAKDFTDTQEVAVEHRLARSLGDEESEEHILIPDASLDLSRLIRENILLNFPMRVLCREECRGLCLICGTDLNEGSDGSRNVCGCKKEIDPRLSVLKDLLI